MPLLPVVLPDDPHPGTVSYVLLRGLNDASGAQGLTGETAPAHAELSLPAGALLFAHGSRPAHPPARKPLLYTVAVYAVDPAQEHHLSLLWHNEYKSGGSRYGPGVRKRLAGLLDAHPVATSGYDPAWSTHERGPNPSAATCHWCRSLVHSGRGLLYGWGPAEHVAHPMHECPSRIAENGDPCALCGVTVLWNNARRYPVWGQREVFVVRHLDHLDCTHNPQPSWEDRQEQLAADRARVAAEKERARAARAEAARVFAAGRELRDAERSRLAQLAAAETERVRTLLGQHTVVLREPVVVATKLVWRGASTMLLLRSTDTLDTGEQVTTWQVQDPTGATTEHRDEAAARAAYRTVFFSTPPPKHIPLSDPAAEPHPQDGPVFHISHGSGSSPYARPYVEGAVQWATWHTHDKDPTQFAAVPGYKDLGDGRVRGVVVVMDAEEHHYTRDGWSFGVEDESGYVYIAKVRPATETEAEPVLTHTRERDRITAAARWPSLLTRDEQLPYENPITGPAPDEGVLVPPPARTYYDTVYRVDWHSGLVWRKTYNGGDGDSWDASNDGSYRAHAWALTPALTQAITEALDLLPLS